jgi:predicted DNA binding CopG/RHH family protein
MAKKLELPEFASEAEEAKWWFANQDLVGEQFVQAAKDGTLRQGTLAKKYGLTPTTTIRLDPADIALAREQAEARGMRYQTYLKMLLHQALRAEEKAPA